MSSAGPIPGGEMPGLYSNRFYAATNGQLMRIAFMEVSLGGTAEHGRAAVVLSLAGAEALAESIKEIIARHSQPLAGQKGSQAN